MLENFFWLLNFIRREILEKFSIPGLNMSYWQFCITLAIVSVIITVLINSVKVSSSNSKPRGKGFSKKGDD